MSKEHLTADQVEALRDGSTSGEAAIHALAHIGECDRCAAALAESFEGRQLPELPPGFKMAVFAAIRRDQRKSDAGAVKSGSSRRRELYRYSFRVSIAACITLFLLFSGTINYGMNYGLSIHKELPEVNVITENLRGFSDKLIDFEVMKYWKEE